MSGASVPAPRAILFASMVGTTIELFDFYIYATAAVLVFPRLFFPAGDPGAAKPASLATFGIAFVARPIGSVIFGHFGDRLGRRTTLAFSLATMGFFTVAIGLMPTYVSIGSAKPLLLAACRFGEGLGLGGEWGGAVLLAVENALNHKAVWYGIYPQLGAPARFFLSSGSFLILSRLLTEQQFDRFGWRIPFAASAVLALLGYFVRLKIAETPAFLKARGGHPPFKRPVVAVLQNCKRTLIAGILLGLATFFLFYLMTVFALSWGTSVLGYEHKRFLMVQLVGTLCFAMAIPVSAILSERGRRRFMVGVTSFIGLFGLIMAPLFSSGMAGALLIVVVGMTLLGLTYGPLGTITAELFPTAVRYTGTSVAFSFAAILGASMAPFMTTWLATNYVLPFVGYYLTAIAIITTSGLLMIIPGNRDNALATIEQLP